MGPTGSGELAKFDEGAQLARTISAAAWAPAKVCHGCILEPATSALSCPRAGFLLFQDNLTTQEDLHLSDLSSCRTV